MLVGSWGTDDDGANFLHHIIDEGPVCRGAGWAKLEPCTTRIKLARSGEECSL
jgi:hypothetical protein